MVPRTNAQSQLVSYYDEHLRRHGDTARGAAWPNEADRDVRFDVMLDLARYVAGDAPFALCDYGCGTGELLRRIRERELANVSYAGADASEAALAIAIAKFPDVAFLRLDPANAETAAIEPCDVLVACGLFTVRADLSEAEMWTFLTATLERVWPRVRRGIVFNVTSPIVDWKRDDLFHVSYDALAAFLQRLAGRRIGFRADYGLYEYTAYAMKDG